MVINTLRALQRETFRVRSTTVALFALVVLLVGCGEDPVGPVGPVGGEPTEVAVVLNSLERSLTVVPVDAPADAYTLGLAPEGSPEVVAVRGRIAVVPLGALYPFAAIVDLRAREVIHTVALPVGGATGAAFLNDSIALIGNPDLNTVTPVNVLRGTAGAEIPVGIYPHKIVEHGGRAYVLNANLEGWMPAGPGSVSVIDGSLAVVDSIPLTGENPGAGVIGDDGRLWIVQSGAFGANNGALSAVDPASGQEIAHFTGFGDFPGGIAATAGRIFVGSYSVGILEWNPATETFVRGPDNPIAPASIPPVASIGVDSEGRLYAVTPGECIDPGRLLRIGASGDQVTLDAPVGICPFGLAFTVLEQD